ncbi:hypothetical protein R1sor_026482 [Riccia sorocarpa]|uniref:Core domain-containing protein n=1 Tax=Riccia sorocarpa TaxID=122646 RepID=A0ABD3GH65_9MARC
MAGALSVGSMMINCGVISKASSIRPSQAKMTAFKGTSLLPQRSPKVCFVSQPKRFPSVIIRASADTATAPAEMVTPAIVLTEKAVSHLKRLKGEKESLYLRVGVKQGGCSGMSYVMDFEDGSKIRADDSKIEADGITLICDPKSLLFLFGMQLDYSDALIGGGFSFSNPNATSTCGCGKSFAA